jgi:methylmalonyl-CoA/ethylmalonyl-CoA epimerase
MLPDIENELNECVLDHIAIAVSDLEKSVETYTALGLSFSSEREVVESQKVKTAFAPIDQNGHIELLCPTSADSAIQKFMDKKGPGIHHICFKVPDVAKKQKELTDKGFSFIYPEPTEGAGNCLVNFIHPKSTGGVLIEISTSKNQSQKQMEHK